MAIIYSYNKSDSVYGSDLVLVSRPVADDNGGIAFRPTNVTVDSLATYIGNTFILNEYVPYIGAVSNVDLGTNALFVKTVRPQYIEDINSDPGTLGQILTVGASGIEWAENQSAPATVNYGLFSQLNDSIPVTNTTDNLPLIGDGAGTLIVPADGFRVADSFRGIIGGLLSCSNNQTIRIRVESSSSVLLDSGAQIISNIDNDIFSLNLDFTIRKIGGAGVAEIASLGTFHYTKQSNGTQQGFALTQ